MEGEKGQSNVLLDIETENNILKKENAELKETLQQAKQLIELAKDSNAKLACFTNLLTEAHFEKKEKLFIADEIDLAKTPEMINKIFNKHLNTIKPNGSETEKEELEYLFSPGFKFNINNYLYQCKGYNPFEKIREAAAIIRDHFKIEEDMRLAASDKIEQLRNKWESTWENCEGAVSEIISIINQMEAK